MSNDKEQDDRITALEKNQTEIRTNYQWIRRELSDIKNNHLESIYDKLDKVESKLNQRPSWLISSLITLLVALIVYLLTGNI